MAAALNAAELWYWPIADLPSAPRRWKPDQIWGNQRLAVSWASHPATELGSRSHRRSSLLSQAGHASARFQTPINCQGTTV